MFAAFGLIALYGLWLVHRRRRIALLALVVVGVSVGLIHAFNAGWTYTAVIDRAVNHRLDHSAWIQESGAVALFVGATVSAMLCRRFKVVPFSAMPALLCSVGGFLMGLGARMVPGGNETLMLWSIPGLALYGIIAYATMIASIASLLVVGHMLARHVHQENGNGNT